MLKSIDSTVNEEMKVENEATVENGINFENDIESNRKELLDSFNEFIEKTKNKRQLNNPTLTTQDAEDIYVREMLRILYLQILYVICVILFIVIPLLVCDFYFAFTDKSCVHEKAGNLQVNLFTYLLVDAIIPSIQIVAFIVLICISIFNPTYVTNLARVCNSSIAFGDIIIAINSLFTLTWTIIGSIIFWGLIDNNKCEKCIYNYVFALLIIRYLFILKNLHININKNKEYITTDIK
jgi:hypothetical protein